jgi:hypothetical protein
MRFFGLVGLLGIGLLSSSCAATRNKEEVLHDAIIRKSLYGLEHERSVIADLKTKNIIQDMPERLLYLMSPTEQIIAGEISEMLRDFSCEDYASYGDLAQNIDASALPDMEYGPLIRISTLLKDLETEDLRDHIGGGLEGDVLDTRSEWGGTIALDRGKTRVHYYLDTVVHDKISRGEIAEQDNSSIIHPDFTYHRIFREEPHHSLFHQHRNNPGPSLNVYSRGHVYSLSGDIPCVRTDALRHGQAHEFVFTRKEGGMFNVAYYCGYRMPDNRHVDAFVMNLGDYSYNMHNARIIARNLRILLDRDGKALHDKP